MTDRIGAESGIVARLTLGDEKAFSELYSAYKEGAIRFAMRYIKSREVAEDVFQDAFAVIWQSRQFINPDTPFSAYLFTIVKNRVLNCLRNLASETKIKEAILSEAVDSTNITQESIQENELSLLIEKAKGALTPKQREVFEMSRERQLSHAEIAEQLCISKNTVKEHITVSLKVIRSYLIRHAEAYAQVILCLFGFHV